MKKPTTKSEQIFQMIIGMILLFAVFCITGCGGNSCECIGAKCDEIDDSKVKIISIPGCGGCLSSGKGCDSCLWAQSCKLVCIDDNTEGGEGNITAVDVHYYGDGCLGCGQTEKGCVTGCIDAEGLHVVAYENDEDGCLIGCSDGCFGCISTDGFVTDEIREAEELLDMD